MTTLLRALRARFADRPDSEHGQAIVRLSLILVIVAYATLVGPDSPEQARAFTWFYVAFGVEAIVGLAILGAIGFCIQTVLLDALIWPALFPIRG